MKFQEKAWICRIADMLALSFPLVDREILKFYARREIDVLRQKDAAVIRQMTAPAQQQPLQPEREVQPAPPAPAPAQPAPPPAQPAPPPAQPAPAQLGPAAPAQPANLDEVYLSYIIDGIACNNRFDGLDVDVSGDIERVQRVKKVREVNNDGQVGGNAENKWPSLQNAVQTQSKPKRTLDGASNTSASKKLKRTPNLRVKSKRSSGDTPSTSCNSDDAPAKANISSTMPTSRPKVSETPKSPNTTLDHSETNKTQESVERSTVPGPSSKRHHDELDDSDSDSSSTMPETKKGKRATPRYSVKQIQEYESKRFTATEKHYEIKFQSDHSGSVSDIVEDIATVFQEVIDQVQIGLGSNGRGWVRFVLISEELDNAIAVPWIVAKTITLEDLLQEIEKVLQSNEHFRLHDGVKLVVKYIDVPKGGINKVRITDSEEWAAKKRGIGVIKNQDELCFARAIVTCQAHEDKNKGIPAHPQWDNIRQGRPILEQMAKDLHKKAGVPLGQVSAKEYPLFQAAIAPKCKLVVFAMRNKDGVIYEGDVENYERILYLFYHNNHYSSIFSPTAFLETNHFCENCLQGISHWFNHRKCKKGSSPVCAQCMTVKCNARVPDNKNVSADWIKCEKCLRHFKTQICFDLHQGSTCKNFYKCPKCCKFIRKTLVPRKTGIHYCSDYKCQTCQKYVAKDHKCCIPKADYPVDKKPCKVVFFDFECMQETGTHIPNLLVERWSCTNCMDSKDIVKKAADKAGKTGQNLDENPEYIRVAKAQQTKIDSCNVCIVPEKDRERIYSGTDCNTQFCRQLFNRSKAEMNKERTGVEASEDDFDDPEVLAIAHNNQGYDIYFIMQYMIKNGIKPHNLIRNGGKILQLVEPISKVKFIDSLSFLPMPLSKMPSTFNLKEMEKGYFAHFFNKKLNQTYEGTLPDMDDFGYDTMMPAARAKFEKWYNDMIELQEKGEYKFNFQKELVAYCRSDVDILMQGCSEFRRLFKEITYIDEKRPGIDPFRHAVTLASACNLVYRSMFMPENKIHLIPPQGFSPKKQQSEKALRWLHYKSQELGVHIQHAKEGGEFYVPTCGFVDGYVAEKKLVLEYHGCFWKGCPQCFGHTTVNPITDRMMGAMFQDTKAKTEKIKKKGYEVIEIWEHEYEELLKNDKEFRKICGECNISPTLQPRKAFFGGRTNAIKLFYDCKEGEQIKYADFCSLYPFINKYATYGVGKPQIIRNDFKSVDQYFGLIQCKVLPPQNLYLPVLPIKSGKSGKLLFPLCKTCSEEEQTTPCTHSESERMLEGVWVSPELMKALEVGYKLINITEVWHFEETSTYDATKGEKGIFSDYINTFLKIKQECSGWPQGVKSEEEKSKYIEDYFKVEGIKLDPKKIEHNPGLRTVAKLCLNTLWGRFGMRPNLPRTEFISGPGRLYELLESDEVKMKDVNFHGDQFAEVNFEFNSNFVDVNQTTNVVIAAFTTAWARLKLYDLMARLGPNLLYHDTDSCIYIQRDGDWSPPLGNYLGDLTDELDSGDYIKTFVSAGPKNYSYVTNKGKTVCKVRGITLHHNALKVVNHETLKELVQSKEEKEVLVREARKIIRDPISKQILSKPQVKRYRVVYNKRIRLDNYDTIPYGYLPDF